MTRHRYGSLGATAIEYGTIPVSPPKKPTKLARISQRRYGRLATASYAFGDAPTKKPRKQLSSSILSTSQSSGTVLRMLGDDAATTSSGDSLILQQILAESKNQSAWMERWVKKDELQRYIQIGATLAIPLAAAIWKAIFRAARGDREGK